MPPRSLAEQITRELKDEPNDSSETYIVFYDFHGDPPSSRFYTNLERLKDPESQLIQYSVFHTTSQNTARAVKHLAEHYAVLLMTLTGVALSATLLACKIGCISRFPSPKHLVSWMGLCPSLHQSGNSPVTGRMKKDSNGKVRWVLLQAVWTASRSDPRMRELYLRVASRKGTGKAVVRVANKIAVIIWHMLTGRRPHMQVKEVLYGSKPREGEEVSFIALAGRKSRGEPIWTFFIGARLWGFLHHPLASSLLSYRRVEAHEQIVQRRLQHHLPHHTVEALGSYRLLRHPF